MTQSLSPMHNRDDDNKLKYSTSFHQKPLVGRVIFESGKPASGLYIKVRDQRTGTNLSKAITGRNGSFVANLKKLGNQPEMDLELNISILDKNNTEIILDGKFTFDKSSPKQNRFVIAEEMSETLIPIGKFLLPSKGSIIDPNKLNIIDTAIELGFGSDQELLTRLSTMAYCPLPEINKYFNLMDEVWSILEGKLWRSIQFREILNGFTQFAIVREYFEKLVGNPKIDQEHINIRNGSIKPNKLKENWDNYTIISKDNFIPIYHAIHTISESKEDLIDLYSKFSTGIVNIHKLDRIYQEAVGAINSREYVSLKSTIERFGSECGPDDGPIPDLGDLGIPFIREEAPLEDLLPPFHYCIITTESDTNFTNSEIITLDSYSPEYPCPGDTVTINGKNFRNGMTIYFPTCNGRVSTEFNLINDEEITVKLPENASDGEITVKAINGYIRDSCGNISPIPNLAKPIYFNGGKIRISSLLVNNNRDLEYVEPNETVTINWVACPSSSTVTIQIILDRISGEIIVDEFPLQPSVGSIVTSIGNYINEEDLIVRAIPSNSDPRYCGALTKQKKLRVTVLPSLTIHGIELTQGIQYYDHPTVPNNSLQNVAYKDTMARIYVTADRKGFLADETEISGRLQVIESDGQITDIFPENNEDPNAPSPPPTNNIVIDNTYQRSDTNDTLNFVIKKALCVHAKQLRVEVFSVQYMDESYQSKIYTSHWLIKSSLPIRYVRIDDQFNRLGPPSHELCEETLNRAYDLLPSSTDDILPARVPPIPWLTNYRDPVDLYLLAVTVDSIHNCTLTDTVQLALIALGLPVPDFLGPCPYLPIGWIGLTPSYTNGMMAWPSNNTAISVVYHHKRSEVNQLSNSEWKICRIKSAHEIGHLLSLCHVNQGCPDLPESFPCFSHTKLPNDDKLINVAFDLALNSTIGGGNDVYDFMSYACDRWISEHNWNRLSGAE